MKYIVVDAASEADRRRFIRTLVVALLDMNRHVLVITDKDLPVEVRQLRSLRDGGSSIDELQFAQQKSCRRILEINRHLPSDTYLIQDTGWLTQIRRCFEYAWRHDDGRCGILRDEIERLNKTWRDSLHKEGLREQYIILQGDNKDPSLQEERKGWYALNSALIHYGQTGCVAEQRFAIYDRIEQVWSKLQIDNLPPLGCVRDVKRLPRLPKLRL
jgi:hypothetical protein